LFGHRHLIRAMALSADGKTLVTGDEQTIRLWDLDRWDPVTGAGRTTLQQSQEVRSLAMTPDGKILAAGYEDGSVIVWNAVDTKKRITIQAHVSRTYALALSPDGKLLATAGWDGSVKVWDVSSAKKLASFPGGANGLAFTPDGKLLAMAGWQGGEQVWMIKVWESATRKERHILLRNSESVFCLAIAQNGEFLVSGSDQSVKLWDLPTLKERAVFKGHKKTIKSVAISRDGRILASGSADNSIKFWDIRTGKELATLPTGSTAFLAFSPDGNALISGGDHLWDVSKVLQSRK